MQQQDCSCKQDLACPCIWASRLTAGAAIYEGRMLTRCLAVMQGFAADQKSCQESMQLSIPLALCSHLQDGICLLGAALPGVDVCICDHNGRFLPPNTPGYLVLASTQPTQPAQTPKENISTGLRVSYSWDGVVTLLTSEVSSSLKLAKSSLCFGVKVGSLMKLAMLSGSAMLLEQPISRLLATEGRLSCSKTSAVDSERILLVL